MSCLCLHTSSHAALVTRSRHHHHHAKAPPSTAALSTVPTLGSCPRRPGETTTTCTRAAAGAAGPANGPEVALFDGRETWDKLTDRLVGASSIPFSILVLPQVLRNFQNMAAGNNAALSIISWEGYLGYLIGNLLMGIHFAARGEQSAVNVQLIGVLNNWLVLAQVAVAAAMPRSIFLATSVASVVAAAVMIGRLKGLVPLGSLSEGPGVWRWAQVITGLVGLAVVPQILYNTFVPTQPTLAPCAVALLLFGYWLWLQVSQQAGKQADAVLDRLPGSAATLLFALSPLPQLIKNFLVPQSLAGLSLGTMVLALMGNALMVPRALLTRDVIWLVGSVWACLAGWGQFLSMFINVSSSTGQRFVHPAAFGGVSVVLVVYMAVVLARDSAAKGLGSPWDSVRELLPGQRGGGSRKEKPGEQAQ